MNGFLEVIRHDPYIQGAWTSLATLYEEDNQLELARQMRFCGLHIEGDAEEWKQVGMEFRYVPRDGLPRRGHQRV